MAQLADAVVVGSAIVKTIEKNAGLPGITPQTLAAEVERFVREISAPLQRDDAATSGAAKGLA